jgi:hypothetical protein
MTKVTTAYSLNDGFTVQKNQLERYARILNEQSWQALYAETRRRNDELQARMVGVDHNLTGYDVFRGQAMDRFVQEYSLTNETLEEKALGQLDFMVSAIESALESGEITRGHSGWLKMVDEARDLFRQADAKTANLNAAK